MGESKYAVGVVIYPSQRLAQRSVEMLDPLSHQFQVRALPRRDRMPFVNVLFLFDSDTHRLEKARVIFLHGWEDACIFLCFLLLTVLLLHDVDATLEVHEGVVRDALKKLFNAGPQLVRVILGS